MLTDPVEFPCLDMIYVGGCNGTLRIILHIPLLSDAYGSEETHALLSSFTDNRLFFRVPAV
jgi:hypothetical protein